MKLSKHFHSSFLALNLTQFFSALNDNIYKLILVFFLISIKGSDKSNTILSLAGAVFVIPFLLFANLAGTLADRFSKRSIILLTRFLEIFIVALGVMSIALHSPFGGYAVLFLMATQSTLFSPAKYGILPEIVKNEKLSRCNGIMTATTYLAIILGTFLASFLSEVTHKNFVIASSICVVIALFGLATAWRIEKTVPQAKEKKVSANLIKAIIQTLKKAQRIRYLLPTIFFSSYFLFMGAYMQLNMIPFASQSLHLTEIQGGYLFLMTAIGIGLGSFFAGRLSGKEVELGFVPFAALGIGITMIILNHCCTAFHSVVGLLILLGAFGGFYIVPIDAFIQSASPNADRGQNVAAGNFLSFAGVILASFMLAFLGNALGFTAAEGFLVVGILTLLIAIVLFCLLSTLVFRLLMARLVPLFFNLKTSGKQLLRSSQPSLIIAKDVTWADTIFIVTALPRMIHYMTPLRERKHLSKWERCCRFIPIKQDHFETIDTEVLKDVKKEIETGHSVCLLCPPTTDTHLLKEWENKLIAHLEHLRPPLIPVTISKNYSLEQDSLRLLWKQRRHLVKVHFGPLME